MQTTSQCWRRLGLRGSGDMKRIKVRQPKELRVSIAFKPLDGLGRYNESTCAIEVNPHQPVVGQTITLMHEMLHAVDSQMMACKITKRRADHRWIESAAMNLTMLLAYSGLLPIKPAAMTKFIRQYRKMRKGKKA